MEKIYQTKYIFLFIKNSPSPSHKPVVCTEENSGDSRGPDDYSGGSIASGSSGFGSLPKKRTPLLSSGMFACFSETFRSIPLWHILFRSILDLVIGHTVPENNVPVTLALEQVTDNIPPVDVEEVHLVEQGHSRNSSNTSQMSKASGYSSIHSHTHSRQSSSGDSGHIRWEIIAKTISLTCVCIYILNIIIVFEYVQHYSLIWKYY